MAGAYMQDSWCAPIVSRHGNTVSGGAARNVRIAAAGGMDTIVQSVASWALQQAEDAVRRQRKSAKKLMALPAQQPSAKQRRLEQRVH
jgi:hypothetical protein